MTSSTTKDQIESLLDVYQDLNRALDALTFEAPVAHVYNPLKYAHRPARLYLEKYLAGPAERTLLLGMNPGPWGMAQTGVPFGEIEAVRDWLEIKAPVEQPDNMHPKRPIEGFDCTRSEVSGRRLWGYFADRFETATKFRNHFVIFNYCPLIFLEQSGRNRTPDKLTKDEREALYEICDRCLVAVLEILTIKKALGVGKFAEKCLKRVKNRVSTLQEVGSILHPSPASPAANRGWAEQVAPILERCIP
ncbi:MAG TPA: single-stranded DNA-binding protein [Phycisphaerales bacterium]|nr:single-stranded DNA-binding protein [Phycisphaerales bacterium]